MSHRGGLTRSKEHEMARVFEFVKVVSFIATLLSGAAMAQGVAQITPPKPIGTQTPSQTSPDAAASSFGWKSVDVRTLGRGQRSSKFVGSSVVNEANEAIGTVDDLILMPNDKATYAVISLGGLLGLGRKSVVVPYGALQMRGDRVVLRGATKDSLKTLAEYRYPT
jgi:sporulation protein YlmC with PRC-barrel domain